MHESSWLPPGLHAAVVFSIDDVHPGTSADAYEAGGDLGAGALGHLEALLDLHPQLAATLFVTPDWREINPLPTRSTLAKVPWIRDRAYLAPIRPKGTMRLDRHAEFTSYIDSLPRTEVALHGLHHVHHGPRLAMEFQEQSARKCEEMLVEALGIFGGAGLPSPSGMTPPSWNAPVALLDAMEAVGLAYVASACDITSPVDLRALNGGSGLADVPSFLPTLVPGRRLAHIPTNYRATSTWDRAREILDRGGLLSVKAHIVKDALGLVALDGLDAEYADHLHGLFSRIESEYGQSLWWATMAQVSDAVHAESDRDV